MLEYTQAPAMAQARAPSRVVVTTVTVATGCLVANLYYAQPLVSSIGPAIGLSPDLAGSLVSITQIGYGLGLFFLVSLADLVENRTLVLTTLAFTIVGLVGVALSSSAAIFFVSALIIGICSTGAQILLPFVAQLFPESQRGRVVGNVMGGLLTGIMLARPISLFIAGHFGWRAVFWSSAVLMMAIGLALTKMMPRHMPRGGMHYGRILLSMVGIVRERPLLRWRAARQALLFSSFNMFWTAAPLMLSQRFGLKENAIALFALAGAGGALAAPVAGRLADRGLGPATAVAAMASLAVSFYLTGWAVSTTALAVLVVLTLVIDGAVQTNQVVTQRLIFSVPAEIRGRANALYMTAVFAGGAIGSVLGTLTYHSGGWSLTATVGGLMGLIALTLFVFEQRQAART